MCEVNWTLVLEYLKVFLSWPPMAFAIALLLVVRFRQGIQDFLNRMTEGNFFGQSVKAAPPIDQSLTSNQNNNLMSRAAKESDENSNRSSIDPETLPPELKNDPRAIPAIEYVKQHPVETVVEYKKLSFNYSCERLFARIFGTQISLLVFLSENPNEAYSIPRLSAFHSEHQRLIGKTEYQITPYVMFLASFGVIEASGHPEAQEFRITQQGIEFLSYIKANYPDVWNQRAF